MSTTIIHDDDRNQAVARHQANQQVSSDDKYIVPIEVLCVTCKQPIKGWVNSPQWLRVEWISLSGECRRCYQQVKETDSGTVKRG